MSDLLEEEVPVVNPLSMDAIEELGRCFLEQFAPEVLREPAPLDVLDLVDTRLPEFGINVYPATRAEIGHREGATDPKGDGETTILVSEEVWEGLELEGPKSFFARTTVCHEVGHALLHVPTLRRRLMLTDVLARTRRSNLRPYEDPEWQAWAFAGAILMPSLTLKMLMEKGVSLSPSNLSPIYSVSTVMAQSHLKKLKWIRK